MNKSKYLCCDKCEKGIYPDTFDEAYSFGEDCKWCDQYFCGPCFIEHELEEHGNHSEVAA